MPMGVFEHLTPNPYIILTWEPMQNFRTQGKPFLEKSDRIRRKREKNDVNSGHYRLPATPKGDNISLILLCDPELSVKNVRFVLSKPNRLGKTLGT